MADFNVMQPKSLQASSMLPTGTPAVSVDLIKEADASNKPVTVNNADDSIKQPKTKGTQQLIADQQQLDSMLEKMNRQLEKLQNYLRFEKDEDTERMVIFIKDVSTDEVIRQIPSEEFLAISKNINNYLEMQRQSAKATTPPTGLITNEMA